MIISFILIAVPYIVDDILKHTVGTPLKLAHGPTKEAFHPLRLHHLYWGLASLAIGVIF